MSAEPSTRVRRVLDTPRGQRSAHSGATHPCPAATTGHSAREQRLLAQMRDNPRVAYRLEHGVLPAWMEIQDARLAQRPAVPAPPPSRPAVLSVPRPRPASDDGPPSPVPAPRRTRPPLPRRPHSHRKPRRRARAAWRLTAYTLDAAVGALAYHLSTLIL
ncbi:hypothetical protein OUQ99_10670 [Streptomonospora nanhaiensis]|uniref:Uncharacterized protein n=1 Tax=Streptomonospora nanhaiensis TaxID=1323731 RepID=A0ABY6YSY7_9ACTN|nr:hypothetical protein [Streptomonospora nanhaiensis]WAE75503.1 hypothetical protein OUQ99_10670 [Streptomonospora nanhaiensis]